MGTQKTGINSGGPPEGPDTPSGETGAVEEDLGLTEDSGNIVDDPSGFVANAPVQQMMGRRVRPVSNEDLERAHRMQAGEGVPMFEPSMTDKDGKKPEMQRGAQQRGPAANPAAQSKAEEMMPDYLRQSPAGPPPGEAQAYQQVQEGAPQQAPAAAQPTAAASAAQQALFENSAEMLRQLLDQEVELRNRGDYGGAAEARQVAENIAEGYTLERVVPKKKEHPALAKLKANLGLAQIKPAAVEWAGVKWHFAPTNGRLDNWVALNLRDEGINAAALMVSAGLVGVDGVPIYEFLSIPLVEEHTISRAAEKGEVVDAKTISVNIFRKFCTCGVQVSVDEKECFSCGAQLDPFDMPTDLRLLCAERFSEFLEEEFGPYEELPLLFDKKREVMKDRQMDKATLYPLAMPSQEVETTTNSQSGDES